MSEAIGLIGLGRMGQPMVPRLAKQGKLYVWDISPEAVAQAEGNGATAARNPGDLAQRAPLILLCLPTPAIVEQVIAPPDGLLTHARDGSVIVDMTTGDPHSSQQMAALATENNVHYVDAPVLGRPDKCGQWTVPVGGDAAAFARAQPVLQHVARRVQHVGAAGRGMAIKLLNNMMFVTINAITAEVAAGCKRLGIELDQFYDLISASEAATVSPLFKSLMPKMIHRTYDPIFTVDLLAKDLSLAVTMCEKEGIPVIVPRALQIIVDSARAQGLGPLDSAALLEAYEKIQGVVS